MASNNLYLIRHGIAAERGTYADDAERPLTQVGRQKTQEVAAQLQRLDLSFDLILTSPYVRACQTAEILEAAGLSNQVEVSRLLAPAGDIQSWLPWLERSRLSGKTHLALVGHEPDLGNWAEILIYREIKGRLRLKKAGIIGLTLPETGSPIGQSYLFWLTPPRLLLGALD